MGLKTTEDQDHKEPVVQNTEINSKKQINMDMQVEEKVVKSAKVNNQDFDSA